jgi:hypothetical protein
VPAGRAAGTGWQQVSAGPNTSQAILSDGSLWAWGNNFSGQLGVNSSNTTEIFPLEEYNQETWTQVVMGGAHAMGLSRGRVYVAGNGSVGQLGLGNAPNRFYFLVRVVGLPLATKDLSRAEEDEHVFPNPAAAGERITLKAEAGSSRVEFVNSQGRVVAISPAASSRLTVPQLVPGLYLLRLYKGNKYLSNCKLTVN